METDLLTTEEVARRLRVSPGAVRAWLRSGQLRGVRAGRRWRIREADLEEYLRQNTPRHS